MADLKGFWVSGMIVGCTLNCGQMGLTASAIEVA